MRYPEIFRDAKVRQQRRVLAHEREYRRGAVPGCRVFRPVVRACMLEEQVSDKELRVRACGYVEPRQYPVYKANLAIHKSGARGAQGRSTHLLQSASSQSLRIMRRRKTAGASTRPSRAGRARVGQSPKKSCTRHNMRLDSKRWAYCGPQACSEIEISELEGEAP